MKTTKVVQPGDVVIYTNRVREIECTVLSIDGMWIEVAQTADLTKVKRFSRGNLRYPDGALLETDSDRAEREKYAALNASIVSPTRYRCTECGMAHNKSSCPRCGGCDKIENVQDL